MTLPEACLERIVLFCAALDHSSRPRKLDDARISNSIAQLCLTSRRMRSMAHRYQYVTLHLAHDEAGRRDIELCNALAADDYWNHLVRHLVIDSRGTPDRDKFEEQQRIRQAIAGCITYSLARFSRLESVKVDYAHHNSSTLRELVPALCTTPSSLRALSIHRDPMAIESQLGAKEFRDMLMRHSETLEDLSLTFAMSHFGFAIPIPSVITMMPLGGGQPHQIQTTAHDMSYLFEWRALKSIHFDRTFLDSQPLQSLHCGSLRKISLVDIDFTWIAQTFLSHYASPLKVLSLKWHTKGWMRSVANDPDLPSRQLISPCPFIERLEIELVSLHPAFQLSAFLMSFNEAKTLSLRLLLWPLQRCELPQRMDVFAAVQRSLCDDLLLPDLAQFEAFISADGLDGLQTETPFARQSTIGPPAYASTHNVLVLPSTQATVVAAFEELRNKRQIALSRLQPRGLPPPATAAFRRPIAVGR